MKQRKWTGMITVRKFGGLVAHHGTSIEPDPFVDVDVPRLVFVHLVEKHLTEQNERESRET
jgi:hypothetical protein